jgi:hypothetical protein
MSTITLDLKTIVGWGTVLAAVVGFLAVLINFGPPVSMSYMLKAQEKIDRNHRRSQGNEKEINKYSGFVNKLKTDQAVNDEYQKGVQRELGDARADRKKLDGDIQKIIRLLGSNPPR